MSDCVSVVISYNAVWLRAVSAGEDTGLKVLIKGVEPEDIVQTVLFTPIHVGNGHHACECFITVLMGGTLIYRF